MKQQELSFIAGENAKRHTPSGRQCGNFLQNKRSLTIYSAITFPSTCPTDLKAYRCTKTCTPVFLTALSITTPNLKGSKISFNSWMNKQSAMQYYSATQRNEFSSHKNTWMNFKCRLLSERSQS